MSDFIQRVPVKTMVLLICAFFGTSISQADVTPFGYQLGAIAVTESQYKIVVRSQIPVTIAILPGGKTWPRMSLDGAGGIYVGNAVIDSATGRSVLQRKATLVLPHGVIVAAEGDGFRLRRAGKECRLAQQALGLDKRKSPLETLKDSNVIFQSSRNSLMALVSKLGLDGAVSNYLVESIDIERCRITIEKKLGNPDLLVEFGHSESGGWWITGSIEQSLFHSADGRTWNPVSLPAELSSLVSSHIVNEREMWLAAILPTEEGLSSHLLVYSDDGGKQWRNVVENDPLLHKVPNAWLEGQKRRITQ